MKYLQRFLNDLKLIPELFSNEYTVNFMSQ